MKVESIEKEYRRDKTFVYSCQYHVIFCPKYRRKVLVGDVEAKLKDIILGKQEEYGYAVLDMEVMPDHVHLLVDVNPKIGVYAIVSKIKGVTSRELRERFPTLKRRLPSLWTRSRFISSVGAVTLKTVMEYIENQKGR